jgi:hypothetical protein
MSVYADIYISCFVDAHIQILTDELMKKVVQMIKNNTNIVVAFATISLVCFVHPAIGLGLLLLSHSLHAHSALCRYSLTYIDTC